MKKWTTTKITKEQVCFLDEICHQCRNSEGKLFSRNIVLGVTLAVFQKLKIDVSKVKSEEELEKRIKNAFIKHAKSRGIKNLSFKNDGK